MEETSAASFEAFRLRECASTETAIVAAGIQRSECQRTPRADAVRSVIADLVASAMVTVESSSALRADLDRLEKLLLADTQLATQVDNDPRAAANFRERQRHIREEIALLDRQLASVNLLRLIPMARKAAEVLRN